MNDLVDNLIIILFAAVMLGIGFIAGAVAYGSTCHALKAPPIF